MSPLTTRIFILAWIPALAWSATGCGTGAADDEGGETSSSDTEDSSSGDSEVGSQTETESDSTGTETETETDADTGSSGGEVPPCPYEPVDGDPELVLEVVAEGLSGPTFVLADPRDPQRLFVTEKGGTVRIVEAGATMPNAEPFLSVDVADFSEMGLLSMAFHPEYPDDPRVYIHYNPPGDLRTRISEFGVVDGFADSGTERILYERPQSQGNHNGGQVDFGPDGYLYFSIGDGGEQGDPFDRAQTLSTHYGKIMRIDVEPDGGEPYSIPGDNPFVGVAEALPEIWAYGLRNAWRFSFDSATGDMYVGDVGQNAWEEVDIVTAGGNYGWVPMEGNHCFDQMDCDTSAAPNTANSDGYIAPLYDYGGAQRSISGGYVYHSCEVPAWDGRYFFADYVLGKMWALTWDGENTDFVGEVAAPGNVVSFGANAWGDVYVVESAFGIQPPHPSTSRVFRIAPN